MRHPFSLQRYGEDAWLLSFGNTVDVALNMYVLELARHLQSFLHKSYEVIPAYCSLVLAPRLPVVALQQLPGEGDILDAVNLFEPKGLTTSNEMIKRVPVCYDPALGNDLPELSQQYEIDLDTIVGLHAETEYHVFMMGFLPGFAYMGEVNERISFPRKANPVLTKAGAVGIAGRQTGVYPSDSPGGWQIVGYTPIQLFNWRNEQPFYFNAGNKVSFYPISLESFFEMKQG